MGTPAKFAAILFLLFALLFNELYPLLNPLCSKAAFCFTDKLDILSIKSLYFIPLK